MKTIKNSAEVKRVKDGVAAELVKKGSWSYCKKSEWKKIRGPVAQSVSKKNVEQPWKDKRRRKDEPKIVDGAVVKEVKEVKEVVKEMTAADIMAGGDKVMQQAMDITAQEDKKGKKTNKKSKK